MSADTEKRIRNLERQVNAQTSVIEAIYRQIAELAAKTLEITQSLGAAKREDDRRGPDRSH